MLLCRVWSRILRSDCGHSLTWSKRSICAWRRCFLMLTMVCGSTCLLFGCELDCTADPTKPDPARAAAAFDAIVAQACDKLRGALQVDAKDSLSRTLLARALVMRAVGLQSEPALTQAALRCFPLSASTSHQLVVLIAAVQALRNGTRSWR